MLPLLEERFDVLAPDLPGFGRSPVLPARHAPARPRRLADAVEARDGRPAFETAHIARATRSAAGSGSSWPRRGRARTCVAISPAGLIYARENDLCEVDPARDALARPATLPRPEALLRSPASAGRSSAGPTLGRPWRADPADMSSRPTFRRRRPASIRRSTSTLTCQAAGLKKIRCPVLVLWGTKDVVLPPRQGRRFERLIPDCELRYLKGLGHVPMSDDPELLATAIADFALARPGD